MQEYETESKIFKALSEPIRLQILKMISCKEMCSCNLLEYLSISQSTLSHHMKVLMKCGLVTGRKEATWTHYSINKKVVNDLNNFIFTLTQSTSDCICYSSESEKVCSK